MFVARIEVGILGVNCYLVGCEETKEALIIDPGEDPDWIIEEIGKGKWNVRYIVNTHCHFDHIYANGPVQEHTGAQILVHEADAERITAPEKNLSILFGTTYAAPPVDRVLKDGELIEVGKSVKLQVVHTPGHTPGSISLYQTGHLFTGDTLFSYGIGRTDFEGGSYATIMESIGKLLHYPDDTQVYPGHNTLSKLGEIKLQNPFVREKGSL